MFLCSLPATPASGLFLTTVSHGGVDKLKVDNPQCASDTSESPAPASFWRWLRTSMSYDTGPKSSGEDTTATLCILRS